MLALPSKTRISQPQSAVGIDWSNSLTQGLMVAFNSAYPLSNPVNRYPATGQTGTGITTAYSKDLALKSFSGSGAGKYQYATNTETDKVTFMWAGLIPAAPVQNGRIISAYNGAGLGRFDLYLSTVGDGLVFQCLRATTNGQWYPVNGAGFKTTRAVFAVRYDGGNVNNTPQFFINGSLYTGAITTLTTPSGALVTASTAISVGGRLDVTTRQMTGDLSFAAAWNRGLTDSEIFSLSQNPWQIFQPDKNSIYFNFAVAGIDLAANAQSTSTATGDIAQSTALSASAISQATATGDIAQSTSLNASASGVATATGDVSTGVPGTALAGSATASATATGALSQATALTGGASAIVTASGTVNDLTPKLAGNAVSTATASATFFSELKRITSYRYAPGVVPEDLPSLVRFLQLELYNIKSGLDSVADGHLDKSYTAPYKPSDGDIRYADGSYWNPGSGPGIYRYNGSAWVFLG